jgi:hypothetical protein
MLAIRGGYENVRLTSSGASRCDGPRESEGAAGGARPPVCLLSSTSPPRAQYSHTRQDSTRPCDALTRIQFRPDRN